MRAMNQFMFTSKKERPGQMVVGTSDKRGICLWVYVARKEKNQTLDLSTTRIFKRTMV